MKVKLYDKYRKRNIIVTNQEYENIKGKPMYSNYEYREYIPEDLDINPKSILDLSSNSNNIDEKEQIYAKEKHKEELMDIIATKTGILLDGIEIKGEESILNENRTVEIIETKPNKVNKRKEIDL